MSNIQGPSGRSGSMQLNTNNTTMRQSPRTDFGAQMRNGVAGGAQVAAGAVGVAAPFVPGGAVVSAALSGAAKSMGGGGGGSMGAASGGAGVSAGDIPFNGPDMNSATGSGSSGGKGNMQQDLMNQTQDMQEMMASFNLQYLQLQNKMQAENRSYTTISNVMKTKHDTAKSSIQNVR